MSKQLMNKLIKNTFLSLGVAVFCTSYMALAAPQQIQAGIEQPKIRGAYSNPNNIKLEGDISLERGNQVISVSLRDSDVKQALRMFADKAGLNIIFHSSVEGQITLDLVNVTLNDAFKMIMQMSELSYLINKDTIMVMSSEASKHIDVSKENMSIIPVKYVDAASIAQFLNKNIFSINKPGLSNNEIVVTNPIKNELLIFGTDNDYKMAKRIVDKLDVQPHNTTYKVNHTTPKEMAYLLCNTLFSVEKKEGETDNSSGEEMQEGDGKNLSNITLGGGVVACKITNKVETEKLTSLGNNTLTVVYHPALGAVSVFGGSPEQINMVNEFITSNDRKQPQAFIEIAIVELTEEGIKEFNSSWQVISNDFNASLNGGFTMMQPLYYKGNGPGVASSSIQQTLSFLIENSKGRVLANPKVMVTNGKQSLINLTEDYVEKVDAQILTTTGGTASGGVEKTYTIGKDAGIQVKLVPFISPDGYVSMNLAPSYATILKEIPETVYADDGSPMGTYTAATLLNRRNMELSNVRIKDGETLVLGGLIREIENQTVSKVPILGDIPILGLFFKNQKRAIEKTELVITITPRIIKDTEDVTNI